MMMLNLMALALFCGLASASGPGSSTRQLCSMACRRGLANAERGGGAALVNTTHQGACEAQCHQLALSPPSGRLGAISPGCVAAYARWNNDSTYLNDPTLHEAEFSSADMVTSLTISAQSLLHISLGADPTEGFLGLGDQIMKDYGNYDACALVDGAQYCTTSFMLSKQSKYGPFATCVPNECSPEDVNLLWEAAANLTGLTIMTAGTTASLELGGIMLQLHSVAPFASQCGDKHFDYTAGSYVMITLVCIFAGLVALATAFMYGQFNGWCQPGADGGKPGEQRGSYVMLKQELATEAKGEDQPPEQEIVRLQPAPKGYLMRAMEAFSLYTTLGEWVKTRENAPTTALDGIRVFSMAWVVFGHTLLWPLQGTGYTNEGAIVPFEGTHDAIMSTWSGQAIQSAEFSVDSFFFMSGFLASYVALKKMRGSTPLSVAKTAPGLYLHRYLRISPLYFIIVWFYYEVVPLTADSPYFDLSSEKQWCKDHWLKEVTYVKDFWPADGLKCYGVSWYLSDDMIFFWFTPVLFAAFFWNRIAGYLLPVCGAIASIAYSWWAAYHFKWRVGTFDGSKYQPDYYVPPWTRCPPYLIGIVFGYFYRDWKQNKRELPSGSWLAVLIDSGLLGLSFLIMGACVYGAHSDAQSVPGQMKDENNYAYVALSKPAWSVGLAIFAFLCFEMRLPLLARFLSLPFFQCISKLTFAMYLLHPMVLTVYFSNKVDSVRYTNLEFTINYLGVLVVTTALALLAYLVIELPLSTIERMAMDVLLGKKKGAGRKAKGLLLPQDRAEKGVDADSHEVVDFAAEKGGPGEDAKQVDDVGSVNTPHSG